MEIDQNKQKILHLHPEGNIDLFWSSFCLLVLKKVLGIYLYK